MEQPVVFLAQGEYGKVSHPRTSLYDLKKSPRACFEKFSDVIQVFGLKKKSVITQFSIDNQQLVLFFYLFMLTILLSQERR